VRFVDRADDAIRRRGENISAWEIESVVAAHPAVEECAAVGVPSELGEHDVELVAVPGGALTEAELFAFCLDGLPYYMVPRYVELVDELPKTPSLRVQKFRLREAGATEGTWDCERHGHRIRRPELASEGGTA
jgi:crotonobetaine/carnitine-CoA ligase